MALLNSSHLEAPYDISSTTNFLNYCMFFLTEQQCVCMYVCMYVCIVHAGMCLMLCLKWEVFLIFSHKNHGKSLQ